MVPSTTSDNELLTLEKNLKKFFKKNDNGELELKENAKDSTLTALDPYIVPLVEAISTEEGYKKLGGLFNELVGYSVVIEKFLTNSEALYWLSLKKGSTEPNKNKRITVSRDERINELLSYSGSVSIETWNIMAVNLNKLKNSSLKETIKQSFVQYDNKLEKKINWELIKLPDQSISEKEVKSVNQDENLAQGIVSLNEQNDLSIELVETTGKFLYSAFNSSKKALNFFVIKISPESNTDFEKRRNDFFSKINKNSEFFYNNIIAVLMGYSDIEVSLEGGIWTARGSLWTILSATETDHFTLSERIVLIKQLFSYIEKHNSDSQSELSRRAEKLLTEQIKCFKTQNVSQDEKNKLSDLLKGPSVPVLLKNKVAGLVNDFDKSNGKKERPRKEAFNIGQGSFFALPQDDLVLEQSIVDCRSIVTQLNRSINGAGMRKRKERVTEFFNAFFEKNNLDDNLKRLVAVLMNTNHRAKIKLSDDDWFSNANETSLWEIFIKDSRFKPEQRIKLIQYAFDYCHILNQKTDPNLVHVMEFINDQIEMFLTDSNNSIHDILPSIFNEKNFNYLRANSDNHIVKNMLKNCFCARLHDSLYQVGREEDWQKVAKATGFAQWGKTDIEQNNSAWNQLTSKQQAEKTVLCKASAQDKAEAEINQEHKDDFFNNYNTIRAQLNRLYPTGFRSAFNWLGAIFRTIAYDCGFNTKPKSTYEEVIDLEDLSLDKKVKPSSTGGKIKPSIVVPVDNGADTTQIMRTMTETRYHPLPKDDVAVWDTENTNTASTTATIISENNNTQVIDQYVQEYRKAKQSKNKWSFIQNLATDGDRVKVYLALSAEPTTVKSWLGNKENVPSERDQFANYLVKNSINDQQIQTFVEELKKDSALDIQAFEKSLDSKNLLKFQKAIPENHILRESTAIQKDGPLTRLFRGK